MADTKRGATLTRKYMEFPTEWTIVSTEEEDQNPEEGPIAYENPPAPSSNPQLHRTQPASAESVELPAGVRH
jgi:hypothetical protein